MYKYNYVVLGLKDSSINLQNVSDVEINTVSNSTKGSYYLFT